MRLNHESWLKIGAQSIFSGFLRWDRCPVIKSVGQVTTLLAFLFASLPADAKPELASIFSDHMVLQQRQPVPVWGWAEPGEPITVTFAGQIKKVMTGPDRRWMIKLDPLRANAQAREFKVQGSMTTVILANVVVGEVWLCGGQSNMGMGLNGVFNAPAEVAAATLPALRFMQVSSVGSLLPSEKITANGWKVCTPQTAANFAATAYFFGRKLHQELKVPVGLIEFDRGDTGIEGWVPLESYQQSKHPALQEIYRKVSSWNPETPIGKKAHTDAFEQIKAWLPVAKSSVDQSQPPPPEPLLPVPYPHRANPSEIYNGTVHPLAPYAIRGAAWYQGESNPGEGEIYQLKMEALISGWRQRWAQPKLPFYYVQLANEGYPKDDPNEEAEARYVPVREAQRRVSRVPHTGMVVAIDLGEDANGHPRNKKDVGERLANWALARTYKLKVAFSGPLYRTHRINGNKVILNFYHAESGLMVGNKEGMEPVREIRDGPLKYFAVAGADGQWHWADARIVGKTVVVRSDKVPAPVKLRYAYMMNPKGNILYNRAGFPASPFRTDDW